MQMTAWGGVLAGAGGIAGPHVQRDRSELGGPGPHRRAIGLGVGLGRPGRIEIGEERVGGLLGLAHGAPDDLAGAVVGHQREVVMPAAPGDLVDPDLKQLVQTRVVKLLVTDALDDPPDGLPVHAQQPRDRRLVGLGHQPRDEIIEVAGASRAVAGKRDALDMHTMLGAAQPTQRRIDLQVPHAQIQMAPDRLMALLVLAMTRREGAVRAHQPPTTQRDPHDDPIGLEDHRAHPHPFQLQQTAECSTEAGWV
jgi:hypothetical protein